MTTTIHKTTETDVALQPIVFREVSLRDGALLVLRAPLELTPIASPDDARLMVVSDEASGIDAYGYSLEEVREAIRRDIEVIWHNYAHPDSPLTPEAAAIGRWWKNNAICRDRAGQ